MPPEAAAGLLADPLRSRTPLQDLMGIYPRIAIAFPGCLLVAVHFASHSRQGRTERLATRFRRRRLPESHCTAAVRREPPGSSVSRTERVLSIVLIAAVLVAVGTTILIVVSPKEGERFTEFYILGPTGKAADYPTEFMAGTPQTVIIGIGNHESGDVTYTVETFAVESRFNNATNESVIISATPLDRFSVTVPNNRTVEQPYTFRIMDSDTDRLEFLLFAETPPDEIPAENLTEVGYRSLYLRLRVH